MFFKNKKIEYLIGGLAGAVCLGAVLLLPIDEEQTRTNSVRLGNGVIFQKKIVRSSSGYNGVEITQTKGNQKIDYICYRDFNGDGTVDCITRFNYFYGLKIPILYIDRRRNYSSWKEWFDSGDFLLRKEMKNAGF